MLVIGRKEAEDIYIRDNKGRTLAVIRNLGTDRGQTKLGIVALDSIVINRGPKVGNDEKFNVRSKLPELGE